jgi:hypothetical protein
MREAARNPTEARAILLGVLISDGNSRDNIAIVARLLSPDLAARAEAASREVGLLGEGARLPLLDLTLPALRTLPEAEARAFETTVSEIIGLDDRILPFEFAVFHTLRRHLPHRTEHRRGKKAGKAQNRERRHVVLSAVAWAGARTEEEAALSFEQGTRGIGTRGPLLPRGSCGLVEVDAALQLLEESPPLFRKRLLDIAQAIVEADRAIGLAEVEMLRAIAAALDVPIPPVAGR